MYEVVIKHLEMQPSQLHILNPQFQQLAKHIKCKYHGFHSAHESQTQGKFLQVPVLLKIFEFILW